MSIIIYCLFMPDHVVAFPEKLLKTIVNRLAAGDPLGSISAPPGPLATILLREGEGKRGERRGGKEVERE